MSRKFFILVSSCLALINQSFSQYIVNNSTVGVCICVTTGSCSLASGTVNDGSGNIDLRIVNVSVNLMVSVTHIKNKFDYQTRKK